MSINHEIGIRIRGARDIEGMSIPELAQKTGITAELIEQYEGGKTEISVSALQSISGILGVSMTELMTGEAAKLSVYSIVRRDKGVGIERRKAYDYKSLAYNFSHRSMDPFLIIIEPAPEDEPIALNSHQGQEFHYCMEGSFRMRIGNHEFVINEGDSIYFDSTYPHGMKALGSKPAREIVIINNLDKE
ncbi:MAG: XRE family transcriptional regulator [Oscillospiraceae bacterium]|nr:XRE family transcriptional regulator [Oscillospiraceae bacterium]